MLRVYQETERKLFIDNLLFSIQLIIMMISWTDLAPCEFGFTLFGSLTTSYQETLVEGSSSGNTCRGIELQP